MIRTGEGEAMRDPIVEFQNYNRAFAQRNPELLRFKVARMAASPFAFYRGTFHLYARDVLDKVCETLPLFARQGVEMELVGDIHSENYGTFKADDGKVHYDINDFDETTHGRFDFDVSRLATSLFLASREREDSLADATLVALTCLTTYTDTVRRFLKKGKEPAFDVSEDTPSDWAAINEYLQGAAAIKRPVFIDKLTELQQGHRRLLRSHHYFNLPEEERAQALRLLEDYRGRMAEPPEKDFYEVEDVCGRVSGIGSMGRLRYVVLVAGKGTREARNVLLEFKEARPSAYDLYRQRETDAAAVRNRAEHVIAAQRQAQTASNSRLGFAVDGDMSFQVRELGPNDTRLNVKDLQNAEEMRQLARIQAEILARTHARAAARAVGLPHPLAGLEDADTFCQRVLSFVLAYADLTQHDWMAFVRHREEIEDCERWAK
jgi:uncharacterized protein (DUF2252 family)